MSWGDIADTRSTTDRLLHLLELWRYQSPWFHDEFDRVEEVFPAASYQYVLYGMDYPTEVEPAALTEESKTAERALRENAMQTERLCSALPRHRDLLRKIAEHGLQPV